MPLTRKPEPIRIEALFSLDGRRVLPSPHDSLLKQMCFHDLENDYCLVGGRFLPLEQQGVDHSNVFLLKLEDDEEKDHVIGELSVDKAIEKVIMTPHGLQSYDLISLPGLNIYLNKGASSTVFKSS